MSPRRQPVLMTTTLWDFPSQQYGDESQGSKDYAGATPAYIIWNLLKRYTKEKDLVVDPMAGSGTTLDVARELDRRALGYDLYPTRQDIFHCDARKLPLESEKADFVFIDPPYSTHIDYGDDPRDIGKLAASARAYYDAMERVIMEIDRILRPGHYMALYVSDSFVKDQYFCPIGFELFLRLRRKFEPVDIIAVVRHNRKLMRPDWHGAAAHGNFFLRGFGYLFIMRKSENRRGGSPKPHRGLKPHEKREGAASSEPKAFSKPGTEHKTQCVHPAKLGGQNPARSPRVPNPAVPRAHLEEHRTINSENPVAAESRGGVVATARG